MRHDQTLTAVVLAGGRSERFGDDPKATATLGDRPLVERVVDAVRTATGRPPVVAAGPPDKRRLLDDALSGPVRYAADAEWCSGPLAGLCGALEAVSTGTIFLCGCDMPAVSPRAVSWLADRHAATGTDATVPLDAGGEPQPLHGVYRTASLGDYCARRADDHRLRSLVAALTTDTVRPATVPDDIDVARSMRNVNTKRELAALAAREDEAYGGRPTPLFD